MTDQSISAALCMNNGTRVAAAGGKGQFSGQNSRQDSAVLDAEDAEFSEATAATSTKSSGDGDKASQSGEAPDFDALLQSVKIKKDAAAQTEKPSNDTDTGIQPDVAGRNCEAVTVSPDEVLAKLIESLNSPDAQANISELQSAKAQAQTIFRDASPQLQAQPESPKQGAAQTAATEQAMGKPGADFFLDQKAASTQMPGASAKSESATGKTGLFDAYAVDTKPVSAFDKIVPVVKEAVLSPSQKALRDGFTVLRQETHFAPTPTVDASGMATTNAVFQQIGTAIANDLAPPPNAKPEASSSTATAQQSAGGFRIASGGDALRVLDIQLHPADLGKVRLSIRVNDTSVDVRVEVTNAATAKVLEGNKQLLDQLLSKAGYRADHISIVAIDEKSGAQITPPSQNNNSQSQTGQQGQSGTFNSESGDTQQGNGDQQQGSPHGDDVPGRAADTSQLAPDEVHNGQDPAHHSNGITL